MGRKEETEKRINEYKSIIQNNENRIKETHVVIEQLEKELKEWAEVKHGDVFIFPSTGDVYLVTFLDGTIRTSGPMKLGYLDYTANYANNTDRIQKMFDKGVWKKVGNVFQDYYGK